MKIHAIRMAALFCLTLSITICQGQGLQQATKWTLYNVRGAKFYQIPVDSLNTYHSYLLNDDSMRTFLSHCNPLPSDKAPLWMGAYVTSCVIDKKKRKIDISSYGGFLFDETEKKYYSIPDDLQREWLNYLADCSGANSSK